MPCAYNRTRKEVWYRHESFNKGLRAAGYDLPSGEPQGRPGDVLLIWNRYGSWDMLATRFEAAGGTVIVAENGYLSRGGVSPHSMPDRDVYALAVGGHNGSGYWTAGGPERWDALGIELKPWRSEGSHVLIAPNRSFGRPGMIMPPDWAEATAKRLGELTKRVVMIRAHPGNAAPQRPMAEDLRDCWAVVIWHSSFGLHALIAGVPVICLGKHWIAKAAAGTDLADIETPKTPDRLPVLQRLAWAQWGVGEIEAGEPFARLAERLAA